jgi:hypothetical protein
MTEPYRVIAENFVTETSRKWIRFIERKAGESREDFEKRRKDSVAMPPYGSSGTIK